MKTVSLGVTPDQEEIIGYELKNGKLTATFMNYGANLLSLIITNSKAEDTDVVLGYEKIEDYFVNAPGFGCCIAPFANRIGNASFTLEGVTYSLDKNDNHNNLHSGNHPLHRRIWEVTNYTDHSITFHICKKHMDMGFPGNMDISMTYTLSEDNALILDYYATTDRPAVFNPTNHSYFNLKGESKDTILDHEVWIKASTFTYADKYSIPDGTILSVEQTPMDFRIPKTIGKDIDTDYHQLNWGQGYDHNYILDKEISGTELVASLYCPVNQWKMEVYTNLPGLQLYTGNFLGESEIGKGNRPYHCRQGVCFETQFYPNALNIPEFPQPVITPEHPGQSQTIYRFLTD